MASGSAVESGAGKVEQLVAFGADAFSLNLTRAQAETDSAAALLNGVTGVWFVGGDQGRLVAVLGGTKVLDAIRARHAAGAVLGGTSAGAAIMSDSMLTGNQVLPGTDTLGYHGDEFRRIARRTIEVVPGFGFLSGTIIDQHFIERERHNRLLSVILERPALIGAGIAEGTALEVAPEGGWSVHGRGAVVVYDARRATVTEAAASLLGAADIRMHVLPAGARYDPATGTARLP
jgi:cyanophycinase